MSEALIGDEQNQRAMEDLRSQLEARYEAHLEGLKDQYEAQIDRLQMQLKGLHSKLHGKGWRDVCVCVHETYEEECVYEIYRVRVGMREREFV